MFAIVKKILNEFFVQRTYASELDQFIRSRNPQCAGDIDRLTKEYEHRTMRGFL